MRRDVIFNMIVAVDEEFGFGKDGKIPWKFQKDFEWFQKHTKGHPCIMGRRTYEDLIEMNKERLESKDAQPLRERQILVLTRGSGDDLDLYGDTKAFSSIDEIRKYLLKKHANADRITAFLCGGRRIYEDHISMIDKVFLTIIEGDYNCDRKLDLVNITKDKKIIHGEKAVDDGKELTFLTFT